MRYRRSLAQNSSSTILCIMDEINQHIRPLVDAPIYGDGGD
jgi:hypothetical protein